VRRWRAAAWAAAWAVSLAASADALAQEDAAEVDAAEGELTWWESLRERIYVSGTFETEFGIEVRDGDLQKWENILTPEFEMRLPKGLDLTVIPRLRIDAADELFPDQPSQAERAEFNELLLVGDHIELELREAYIETVVRDTFLTIGKQQVVWGQADGLKVLDVVNPQDFREFVFDDFDDSRIPLWMVNAEIPIKNVTLQLLWIPDRTYHELPEEGSPFEFVSNVPQAPPGVSTIFEDPERPDNFFTDSDFGARLSTFAGGWDLTFNYLYFHDDVPALFRTVDSSGPAPVVTVAPEYERAHLIGATFSNAFGDLTLRGEVGMTIDRFFPTEDPADSDGVRQSAELGYVIGLDWFGVSETLLSFQFFQSVLTNDGPGLLRDRVENQVSFLFQRDFMNDSLVFSTIVVHGLNRFNGFIRPKIEYDWTTSTTVWAGFDIPYGDEDGLFGQFRDAQRVVFGLEYAFG